MNDADDDGDERRQPSRRHARSGLAPPALGRARERMRSDGACGSVIGPVSWLRPRLAGVGGRDRAGPPSRSARSVRRSGISAAAQAAALAELLGGQSPTYGTVWRIGSIVPSAR